jgi:hypothetical protein
MLSAAEVGMKFITGKQIALKLKILTAKRLKIKSGKSYGYRTV